MTPMPKLLAGRRGRNFGLIVLALIGQAIAAGAAAFATRDLFSSLAKDHGTADPGALLVLALSGLAIAVFHVIARLLGERMGQSYAYDIRCAIYAHTSRMARGTVANRRSGAIALRFVGDLTALRSWASLGLPQLIAATILIPVTLSVLFLIEPEFGLYALPLFVFAILVMAVLGWRLPAVNQRLRSARWKLAADMTERMPNAPYFDSIGRTDREMSLIRHRTDKLITVSLQRVRAAELVRAAPEVLAGLTAALIIWLGFRAGLPTASVAGGLAALGLGLQPMRDLGLVWNRYSAWRAAHVKSVRALSQPTRPDAQGGGIKVPRKPSSVAITNARICADGAFSASVAAGSKVAVLGPSGSGKSTVLALLAGQIPDMAHTVKIGDTGLDELSAKQRARLITYITADDPLLKGSLRRALTLGLPKRPKDSEIIAVAMRIGLGPILDRLGGLDGKLCEGGRNLSSGERARCLAARAMLSTTPMVLLDGLAEMLDVKSQAQFFDWIAASQATIFTTMRSPATEFGSAATGQRAGQDSAVAPGIDALSFGDAFE